MRTFQVKVAEATVVVRAIDPEAARWQAAKDLWGEMAPQAFEDAEVKLVRVVEYPLPANEVE